MCPGDQRCLGREYLCDGNADCLNALDESPPQCNGTCRPGAFFCGTATSVGPVRAAAAAGRPGAGATIGRCHKNWRRCDTKRDCADGSDERGCLPPDRRLLLTCDGGRVVQSRHVRCDGYLTDCRDGSDERQCGSGSACPPNTTFSCDGFCRPMARWCDRRKDCSDGSDEASCDFTLTTTTTTATTSRITATLPPPTSTSTSTTSSMNASSSPRSLTTPEATFSSKAEGGLVAAGSRPPEQQETPRVGANDTRVASAAGETSRGGGALAVVLSVIGALIFVHVAISLAAGVPSGEGGGHVGDQ
ncbi:Low-density lipoprotein receptor-related protein 2 [Frankliniella fusca]|uniref:Low-density lipoprotein receptor-related protein 2 n=1 Tax=Frankliniella fusca TaxID=407009 RepID=A0AAE1HT19_9NEOP|nr:Low-density lipoprotein receptor-related protein 2 [Frankliniella fusca]